LVSKGGSEIEAYHSPPSPLGSSSLCARKTLTPYLLADPAVSSGLRYIDTNGDPAAESALGAALASRTHSEREAITVGTVLTASAPGHMHELAEAAAMRMGVSAIGVLCLEWEWDSGDVADNGWDDVGGLEAAWREMAAVHQAGLAKAVSHPHKYPTALMSTSPTQVSNYITSTCLRRPVSFPRSAHKCSGSEAPVV
jgi:hypothetical protein